MSTRCGPFFPVKLLLISLLCSVSGIWATAADNVFISEFMAVNDRTITDQDGDYSDWIEIHNAGTNAVNLNGWFLTDKASQLTEWRFPDTLMAPNGYLLVFASGKDRHVAGAELHTNFKLSGDGEYLALVRPDGTNVVSAFSPKFPSQAGGVSYGVPVLSTPTTLLASGAAARVLVPSDGSLGSDWTIPAFNDSAWASLPTGVGFDSDGQIPFVPTVLANSITEFSGVQGQGNWFYGYWNRKTDADGKYSDAEFIPFPNAGGAFGANNFWTGSSWDWFNGDPPFTQITSQGGLPTGDNGNPGLPTHWAVRRYVSEASGQLNISGTLTHTSDWVYVTATGIAGTNLFYLYHLAAGDGYIDDIKLVAGTTPEVGQNLMSNGDFETGALAPWNLTPNVSATAITTAVKHGGTRSLHLVSAAAGASQNNALWANSASLVSGQIYTLSYWYLPAPNSGGLEVRSSGRWLDTFPTYCGDGTIARIFVDGVQVYQQSSMVSSRTFSITVPAQTGSKIDFALDPGSANDGLCDGTIFTATVQTADPNLALVADSAADWSLTGIQGEHNWFYGYYNKTADPDHVYQPPNFIPFPRAGGPLSTNNFWDEEEWKWFSGNPPFDRIGQYWMSPNGTNSGAEHWVIRRWVSTVSGTVSMDWAAFKEYPDQNNAGGGGVTIHIFHNGVQRDLATVAGGDVIGVNRTVTLTNVAVGDFIDIALDPTNTDGRPDDDTDRTFITASMHGFPSLNNLVLSNLESSMRDINATAYLRLPFTVADPSIFNSLILKMKFDDGFVAFLNGVEVARVNAPLVPTWNSAATDQRSDAENNVWQEFNIGTFVGFCAPAPMSWPSRASTSAQAIATSSFSPNSAPPAKALTSLPGVIS